jgi:ABC-2 type transport system permease protein
MFPAGARGRSGRPRWRIARERPIKRFSGGIKHRLNIACGVIHRPKVDLDEPTVGDPQSRERIYDMLAELTREGVSLLLTTHHLEEAEARCSRTIIIDHGRVIATGTLSDLVDQTVGRYRVVTLRLDAPATTVPEGAVPDAEDPLIVRARVKDVVRDPAGALTAVTGRRLRVRTWRCAVEPAVGVHPSDRKGAAGMIPTLLRVSWTNLKRDRVAQALTFLLPIIFFSIFATVFGNQGRSSTPTIRVAVVDEDGSELSRRIVEGLKHETSLRVRSTIDAEGTGAPSTRRAPKAACRGDLPRPSCCRGLGVTARAFGASEQRVRIKLLADVSDQIAPQMVNGLLQKVTMTAAPDLMMQGGMKQFERYGGALTPGQRAAVDAWLPQLKSGSAGTSGGAKTMDSGFGIGVDVVDVMRQGRTDRQNLISFYAAGIGVMFLLFSVSGASGSLLDEMDTGTLDRVLSTRVGMTGLLAAKWIFIALLGVLQLTVMFVWGRLAFGLDLFDHIPGFLVMTVFTAAAAGCIRPVARDAGEDARNWGASGRSSSLRCRRWAAACSRASS